MASKQVTQVICDRCGAESLVSAHKVDPNALKLSFNDTTLSWDDLCGKCANTVSNYVGMILKAKKEKD